MQHPILPDPARIRALAMEGVPWADEDEKPIDTQVDTTFHFGSNQPTPVTPVQRVSSTHSMQPAYGPDPDTGLKREVRSYQWGRDTYHEFVDRLKRIDASIEHPLAVEEMRAYVMRMAIAYSGHPDARIAVKALDMLARMKPIGLYEEKRHRDTADLDATALASEIKILLRSIK